MARSSASSRQYQADAQQLQQILLGVISAAESSQAGDFYYAQQTAMAAQVLAAAMQERGKQNLPLRRATDAIYEAVSRRERFDLAEYRKALEKIRNAL